MLWTLAQVYNKVNKDLDLENEPIVQDSEFVDYVNDAVREVMAALIKLGAEDMYYLTNTIISTVALTDKYALPTDIYSSKIVAVIHDDGSKVYEVRRVRGIHVFADIHVSNIYATVQDSFRYILLNASATVGTKIQLVPTPQESKSNLLTIWYIREAAKLVEADLNDANKYVDCPEEFIQVVLAYVKYQCCKKEIGHPHIAIYKQEYDELKAEMIQVLTDQTHDSDNTVVLDTSLYSEHV